MRSSLRSWILAGWQPIWQWQADPDHKLNVCTNLTSIDRRVMAKKKQAPPTTTVRPPKGSTISRYISFVMLCVTIVVCGFFFYNVIKGFILPLFLATLLAVIFRPFHEWVSKRCNGRPTLAASLSTASIILIVLIPLAGLVVLGIYEASKVARLHEDHIDKLEDVRRSFGLQKPFYTRLNAIEFEIRKLDDAFEESANADVPTLKDLVGVSRTRIQEELKFLKRDARDVLKDLISDVATKQTTGVTVLPELYKLVESAPKPNGNAMSTDGESEPGSDQAKAEVAHAIQVNEFADRVEDGRLLYQSYRLKQKLIEELQREQDYEDKYATNSVHDTNNSTPEKRALRYVTMQATKPEQLGLIELIDAFQAKLDRVPHTKSKEELDQLAESNTTSALDFAPDDVAPTNLQMHRAFRDLQLEYDKLLTELLGGPIWKWALEIVNPSKEQIQGSLSRWFSGGIARWLPSVTNTATSLLTGLLVGIGIMSVALFYFFLDGPKMVNAFMHLSPLDDRHEMELLQEFDKVSRAVVLATLLSAVAQGILGGIGYKIIGLNSVFLLTLVTAVLALIPFVGAAAVWVPCCLYVAFIKEMPDPEAPRTMMYTKAAFLAAYGVLVVSMADNFIKPWVLQGQSKLHPLLALLSVLGGVQALGPIGILVGPMVVAFLQVLLTILQREITSLDEELKTNDA